MSVRVCLCINVCMCQQHKAREYLNYLFRKYYAINSPLCLCFCLSVCLSLSVSVFPSVCLFLSPSLPPPLFHSLYLFLIHLFAYLSFFPFVSYPPLIQFEHRIPRMHRHTCICRCTFVYVCIRIPHLV